LVKKFIFHLSSFIFLLSACATPVETVTPPEVTREANATETVAPAPTSIPVSTLGVEAESLRGVVIMAWHPWFGTEASLFETQVAEFNSTNEWGITVLTVGQSNFSELFNNVTASLAAPDKPNLVIGLPEHAQFWNERSGVVDLAPYVADPIWGLSAEEVASYSPAIWEQDLAGDARLGMPAQRTTRLMFYNVSWARELGFEAPPATPEEFREQACAANAVFRANEDEKDDAFGGWLVDTDPMTAMSWMLAFGGGPQEGESYRFLKNENIAAFRFPKTLFEDGCAFLETESTAFDAFANRQALFVTGGLEDLAAQSRALLTLNRMDEWTLIPFPGETQTMAVYGSSFIAMPSDDVKQLASWLFIRWMQKAENQARWTLTTGMLPINSLTLDLASDQARAYPQWMEAVKLLPSAQGTPRLATWRVIRLVLGDGFEYMFRINMPVGQVPVILADMDRAVGDLVK
jgi:ABC-type glycerol-3-phosphate transport system substrate-binding protein